MPIYMDRHDLSDAVTAEHIARLHQEDLKIQDQFGCRGLTYWFDEKRKTAFCLIEAPNENAIREMHEKAHGDVPHRVIEVDPGIVESFLGRIEDPKKAQNTELNIINDPGFRTIMVIVLQGAWPIPKDPDRTRPSLQHYHHSVIGLLNTHEGNLVRKTENYFLVSFRSVSGAVHAALALRELFGDLTKERSNDRICLKIGLSAGVPVTEKKLIFEETVKSAERMCRVIKGEIIISPEVKELYNSENSNPLSAEEGLFFLTQSDENFLTLLMECAESSWSDINFKVDDFSKPVGCSKSQLYRKMILLTGKSPNTFINEYRLNEALTMLHKNAGNISEIAFGTGFSSPSYFAKCFQKRYGHLPSAYLPARVG